MRVLDALALIPQGEGFGEAMWRKAAQATEELVSLLYTARRRRKPGRRKPARSITRDGSPRGTDLAGGCARRFWDATNPRRVPRSRTEFGTETLPPNVGEDGVFVFSIALTSPSPSAPCVRAASSGSLPPILVLTSLSPSLHLPVHRSCAFHIASFGSLPPVRSCVHLPPSPPCDAL